MAWLSAIAFLLMFLAFLPGAYAADSMAMVQTGVSGSMTSDMILTEDEVVAGTSTGIYVLNEESGSLKGFIQTSAPVTGMVVLSDMTGDGEEEMVIGTGDIYFPNIQCYDISSGSKLWEFSPKTEVYDSFILWTMKQTPVFDMVSAGDISGDGHADVLLSAGYVLYALDGKDGSVLWSFESTDNIWDVEVTGGIVLAGDQNGYVYAFDRSTGTKLWERLVSETYTVKNPNTNSVVGDVRRSVWDIVPIEYGDGTRIAVSAEDGYVHLLDSDGGMVWETQIIEYVDTILYGYYRDTPRPTSRIDFNFFNVRIGAFSDVSGDGKDDIAVYTYSGTRMQSDYKGAVEDMYMLSSDDGGILWENENAELSYTNRPVSFTAEKEFIALPMGKSAGKQKIRLVDPADGLTERTLSINVSSSQARTGEVEMKDAGGRRFVLTSSLDDIKMVLHPENVEWSYPRITDVVVKKGDFTGDATTDILVKSRDGANADDTFDEGQTRILFVIDGATREIAWSYEMPEKLFVETGGLFSVMVTPDLDSDGKSDIAAYIQKYGDWSRGDTYGEDTRLMTFSGEDGSIMMNTQVVKEDYYGMYGDTSEINDTIADMILDDWDIPQGDINNVPSSQRENFWNQVYDRANDILNRREDFRIKKRIESLELISDRSGDGIDDFLISLWDGVIIKDSVNGDVVWERTTREHYYQDPFTGEIPPYKYANWTEHDRCSFIPVGDVDGDGAEELVLVSWEGFVFLTSVSTEPLDYAVSSVLEFKDGFNKDGVKRIEDLNGNGAYDIVYQKHQEDAPSMYVFADGRNGFSILETERSGTAADISGSDFNGNGFDDFIVFSMWTEGGGPRLEVIDGRSKERIWSQEIDEAWMLRENYGYTSVMPASPAGDINGDGITDIALVRSQAWQTGCEVVIYDVKNGEELSKITIEETDSTRAEESRWMPGIKAELLSDVTGDGIGELGVIALVGQPGQKQVKMYVVDTGNGEIVSDFSSAGKEMLDIGENTIGIVGSSGNIYFLDISKTLQITSPATGSVVGSPFILEWTGDAGSVTTVLVDGIRTAMTEDDSAEFEILSGDHKVSIYSFDRYGKGTYDTIDVTVEKSAAGVTSVTLLTLILLGILFSPKILSVIRR